MDVYVWEREREREREREKANELAIESIWDQQIEWWWDKCNLEERVGKVTLENKVLVLLVNYRERKSTKSKLKRKSNFD